MLGRYDIEKLEKEMDHALAVAWGYLEDAEESGQISSGRCYDLCKYIEEEIDVMLEELKKAVERSEEEEEEDE